MGDHSLLSKDTEKWHFISATLKNAGDGKASTLVARPKFAKDDGNHRRGSLARRGFGVGDRNAETFFEGHHEFNSVESHGACKLGSLQSPNRL